MGLPRIFEYKNEKLEKKVSFKEGEHGSFGVFQEKFGMFNRLYSELTDVDTLIIFAPNQKEFSYSRSLNKIPNHGFHDYLKKVVESAARGNLNYIEQERGARNYSGGKEGEYRFKGHILLMEPYWKWNQSEEESKQIGKLLLSLYPELSLKNFKVLKGLHEVVI